ncbi:cbb3-type cytochrome oxidase assembly protein CcoS [Thalassobaculum sp.]|uniref:cbb3-type cytochrome oxidase assembly protein CcoS n=1 Tax=Thalassobaculum sp. TaxID=2022740 RepID=UPI0032ED2A2C
MDSLGLLIPIALAMGVAGLGAFLWSLRHGQYDDLEGAGARILLDDPEQNGDGNRTDRSIARRAPGQIIKP